MKNFVFLILAVTMIGVMVPSVFGQEDEYAELHEFYQIISFENPYHTRCCNSGFVDEVNEKIFVGVTERVRDGYPETNNFSGENNVFVTHLKKIDISNGKFEIVDSIDLGRSTIYGIDFSNNKIISKPSYPFETIHIFDTSNFQKISSIDLSSFDKIPSLTEPIEFLAFNENESLLYLHDHDLIIALDTETNEIIINDEIIIDEFDQGPCFKGLVNKNTDNLYVLTCKSNTYDHYFYPDSVMVLDKNLEILDTINLPQTFSHPFFEGQYESTSKADLIPIFKPWFIDSESGKIFLRISGGWNHVLLIEEINGDYSLSNAGRINSHARVFNDSTNSLYMMPSGGRVSSCDLNIYTVEDNTFVELDSIKLDFLYGCGRDGVSSQIVGFDDSKEILYVRDGQGSLVSIKLEKIFSEPELTASAEPELTEQFDEISQDFFASLIPTYLNYFDETEEEKIIDFMDEGEEKIKRIKTLEDKLVIITDSGSDLITSDNIHRANLSYDDKIFLVETNLDVIDYLKYRLNQQAKEVEIQYELAMKGFNEWDTPDEIKAEYIEDLESAKLQFTDEFMPGIIHIIAKQELELENLLVQLKKENQITNEIYDSQKQFEPEPIKEQKVESKPILSFVDPEKDPSHYVKRYITEETYKDWFNEHFPDYTLYEGIGITQEEYRNIVNELTKPEPVPESVVTPEPEPTPTQESSEGGGCLIATAAFGSEMAPQVQFLREIRDNTVMTTQSGTAFMAGFNQFYYSFSPQIADYERENPVFKEAVKITLTPLLTSLTLLNYVDIDSEQEMLGYGIGIILLNIGMYFVAPAVLILRIKHIF